MKLEGIIAVRYLFATRQRSVANTISWISLVGLLVSTAALIVVLSVYNGIGQLTQVGHIGGAQPVGEHLLHGLHLPQVLAPAVGGGLEERRQHRLQRR